MAYLESAADATITTIAFDFSVIGKLLVSQEKRLAYIEERDISALGWLLTDSGASIVALQNIQTLASYAVSYGGIFIKRLNMVNLLKIKNSPKHLKLNLGDILFTDPSRDRHNIAV